MSSLVLAAIVLLATHFADPVETLEVPRTAAATIEIFDGKAYDLEKVREARVVPRLYLQDIPLDMGSVQPVQTKKDLFVRILLPLILKANEEIAVQRQRLTHLKTKTSLSGDEKSWLAAIAEAYSGSVDDLSGLLERVDVIPPSLGLAQGIDESGWGTSRFAREGESLFGQHAPKDSQRLDAARAGGVGVAAFDGMLKSVQSYFHNLNSGRAYTSLRKERAEVRAAGKPLTGAELVEGLADYSERGDAYLRDLKSIMHVNDLHAYDGTDLAPANGSIVIRPKP